MKKIIALLLCIWTCLMFVSCTNSATQVETSSDFVNLEVDSLAIVGDSLDETIIDEEKFVEKEMEAMILHFVDSIEKRKSKADIYNQEKFKYANKYKVSLYMNGDADIQIETPTPEYNEYTGEFTGFGKSEIINYMGIWVLREKRRGAGFINYYDIEFNNGNRNLNWCVDIDCKYLYFNWNAFEKRYLNDARKILKVDTLFVK